jgi:hypothetical protein
MQCQGGHDAVTLRVAEKYVAAFEKLAKETNTVRNSRFWTPRP